MEMIKVAVCGYLGRMGHTVVEAVESADDMKCVCGIDVNANPDSDSAFPVYDDLSKALEECDIDVMVDFTQPTSVEENVRLALEKGVNCVVGTTGLSENKLEELSKVAKNDACLFYAPNFTTGAVLMMQFAKAAAPYFPEAEVIEYHHSKKKDAPSGTAVNTAKMIVEARDCQSSARGRETELNGMEGARGAEIDGVYVHSVRSMGFVASQEVIFGSFGQTLSIRHDSWDRQSYMPGVLLGIRSVEGKSGLIVGLENFM